MSIICSYASSLFLTGNSRNGFPSINTLKSFISTFGTKYFEKEVLSFPFYNDKTNSLFKLVNVGSIK